MQLFCLAYQPVVRIKELLEKHAYKGILQNGKSKIISLNMYLNWGCGGMGGVSGSESMVFVCFVYGRRYVRCQGSWSLGFLIDRGSAPRRGQFFP